MNHKILSIWFVLIVCFAPLRLVYAETPVAAPDEQVFTRQLSKIEKQIQVLRANQKRIDEKNSEIKSELASLRVWINRR